ncbi:acyl-CoA dehydrogenase family protein [Bradyrhizobium sp. LHD-71]|uniref:acyl-CoA dehydrogenase family protein n=1 Tax=Bradyrhizobium sp. LHD-71 TaxID=3072141 RepID=UPI00280CDCA7|nr:acyl-CoA dehydrogenase family protein [Bradyrhizobium sp. LHD-71]MDQ8730757.1 acyl-CoA dehydrogenase family protein [Bradyrhizobium sp. LHD-71]
MTITDDGLTPADFAATASRAVAACAGLSVSEQGARLVGDGLLGVIAGDNVGGLDLPLSFAVPVVAAASAGLLAFPLMENILLARLLQQRQARIASAIVAGDNSATIAWTGAVSAKKQGDRVILDGWVARAPRASDVGLMLVRVGATGAALVPISAVTLEDSHGIDLTQPEHTVQLNAVSVSADHLLADGTWPALESDALVLRAAAILGSAEACLALAQEHVSTRRQFGRALSYNQAIRHTLARHKLGLEGIRQSIARALFFSSGLRERRAAFLAASSYGVAISEGAVQMHGGMGFTWDVPVHRHVRRIRALQAQGDASGVLAALGHDTIADVSPAHPQTAA